MSAHRTNRHAQACERCRVEVKAGEGTLLSNPAGGAGHPWAVVCRACLPFPASAEAEPRIALRMAGARVQVVLVDRLGGSLWSSYQAAIRGIAGNRKVGGEWETTADVARTAELIVALRGLAGVAVEVDADVEAAAKNAVQVTAQVLVDADARLVETDARLAELGGSLYDYQKTGIPWLASQRAAILADDMGLGKTLQALLAAPQGAPILVICPAVAKGVWVREAGKWRPDLAPVALKGRKSFRWPQAGELVVTNYDVLSEPTEGAPAGCVVILDEAHAIKNAKAARTKHARLICKAARAAGGCTWLLTATPLLNRPPELWSLLTAIDRTDVVGGYKNFARLFGGYENYIRARGGRQIRVMEWGGEIDPQAAERIAPVMLRRMKTEVLLDLPSKRIEDVSVNGLAATLKRDLDKVLAAWDKAAPADVLPSFEGISEARAQLATAKIPAMLALVESHEEAGEPLVVFSAHRAPIDELKGREGWAVITGDTSPEERTRIESAFQAGKLRGVGATIKAGGVAITLTHAARALFVDLDWTPALNSQAEDRIYRIGQERGVLITRLVAEHALDERIAGLLKVKQELITATVDAARKGAGDVVVEVPDAAALDALATELAADRQAAEERAQAERDAEEAYQADLEAIRAELLAQRCNANRNRRLTDEEIEAAARGEAKRRATRRGVATQGEDFDGERSGPQGEREEWAAEALVTLAALDPDGAQVENGVGFSKSDVSTGHLLAGRVAGGLTPGEWKLAAQVCCRYWRQVGRMPAAPAKGGE